jgi:hypothetical protein
VASGFAGASLNPFSLKGYDQEERIDFVKEGENSAGYVTAHVAREKGKGEKWKRQNDVLVASITPGNLHFPTSSPHASDDYKVVQA